MGAVLELEDEVAVQPLEVRPLAIRIGAEVRGVKLGGSLQAGVVGQLRKALLRHRVLFFRDQQHLTDAEHQAFGELWGDIESHPTVSAPKDTAFFELDSQHGGRADSGSPRFQCNK
jgi:alpha-ketoglutarate-dependent taurine dioxygenase